MQIDGLLGFLRFGLRRREGQGGLTDSKKLFVVPFGELVGDG